MLCANQVEWEAQAPGEDGNGCQALSALRKNEIGWGK